MNQGAQTVASAVDLFTDPLTSAEGRKQAADWLQDFKRSEEAWQVRLPALAFGEHFLSRVPSVPTGRIVAGLP